VSRRIWRLVEMDVDDDAIYVLLLLHDVPEDRILYWEHP
jgi:hypothetical protein